MVYKRFLCKWTDTKTNRYYYVACKKEEIGEFPEELRQFKDASWQHETLLYFFEDDLEAYRDALHNVATEAVLDPLCLN